MIETILNEDGSVFAPPKNPLVEKWDSLYPPCEHEGYNCMFCRDCRFGDYWKCPEEDREVYEQWAKEYNEYFFAHNDLDEDKIRECVNLMIDRLGEVKYDKERNNL